MCRRKQKWVFFYWKPCTCWRTKHFWLTASILINVHVKYFSICEVMRTFSCCLLTFLHRRWLDPCLRVTDADLGRRRLKVRVTVSPSAGDRRRRRATGINAIRRFLWSTCSKVVVTFGPLSWCTWVVWSPATMVVWTRTSDDNSSITGKINQILDITCGTDYPISWP